MKHLGVWATLALVIVVAPTAVWLWWSIDLRWRPHTIARDQTKIAGLLDSSGWVSPNSGRSRLYLISYRGCAACNQFEQTALPRLEAAGVGVRVIAIARADENGLSLSTVPERDTVAELWVNRNWNLYQRWTAAVPPGDWTAPGLPHADGDVARSAVIAAGRTTVADMRPLLRKNGIKFAYPLLIWWNKAGVMRGCACLAPQSWAAVEKDLGA